MQKPCQISKSFKQNKFYLEHIRAEQIITRNLIENNTNVFNFNHALWFCLTHNNVRIAKNATAQSNRFISPNRNNTHTYCACACFKLENHPQGTRLLKKLASLNPCNFNITYASRVRLHKNCNSLAQLVPNSLQYILLLPLYIPNRISTHKHPSKYISK